jgi:protein O-GlcNAc transferase
MAKLTIQQAFDLAMQHHQSGRLSEAEHLYSLILAQQPDHCDATHFLGLLAHQSGRNDVAIKLLRRATTLNPDYADAHNNLANILRAAGDLNAAIASYRIAVRVRPDYAEAFSNLGNALRENGELSESVAVCRKAVALKPDYAKAHNNLANALAQQGNLDDAIAAYKQAISLVPNFPEAHNNLGNALRQNGQRDDAVAAYRHAITLRADYADAFSNLGVALKESGNLQDAIAAFRKAIALRPTLAEAHNNLGITLEHQRQYDDAIAAYQQAISLNPALAISHSNLGSALKEIGKLDDAIAACRQAILLNPNLPDAHNNLGNALKDKGDLDNAIAAYRQAVAVDPASAHFHSNLLYAIHLHPAYDARAVADEHRTWNEKHAAPLHEFIQAHDNDRNPDRPLRVGYISPDFRDHVVGRHLLPLLQNHDRHQFEVFCYCDVLSPDALTAQLKENATTWRKIVGLTDEQVSQQIRADKIDLFVDLSGHTANNRLLVFARKPAPLQLTYLGYNGTTGVTTMDYRLSDPHLDPENSDLSLYSEKTIRLPKTYWCYAPYPAPEPSPAPLICNGYITFGCLNNFAKISPAAFDLWATILAAVPNSHLIFHAPPERQSDLVQRLNLPIDRLKFVPKQNWSSYTQTYSQIDIALDPFPYNGGITTCDALWMGVPVITLSGQMSVGRAGRSILSNLNLQELIAHTPEEYANIAISLAEDHRRVIALRAGMRERMRSSPLMDQKGFARDVESAYRQMWRALCAASTPIPSPGTPGEG